MVCIDAADADRRRARRWRFRLARLARPVPPPLQRMALAGEPLEIPPREERRFLDDVLPAAAAGRELISSDGSFSPPRSPGRTWCCARAMAADHALEVSWEWAYQVGDSPLRGAAGGPAGRTTVPRSGRRAGPAGQPRPAAGPLRAAARAGRSQAPVPAPAPRPSDRLDTMRFTTELLPLLADSPASSSRSPASPPTTGRPATRCRSRSRPARWPATPTGSTWA